MKQIREADRTKFDEQAAKAPCSDGRLGCTFLAGARVFDRVTGLEGEVLGGQVENIIVPTTGR